MFLEKPLKTKENPILIETISSEDSMGLIKKGIENGKEIEEKLKSLIQEEKRIYEIVVPFINEETIGEYQIFSKDTEVSFLALTPNILLIHGENWICDFCYHFIG